MCVSFDSWRSFANSRGSNVSPHTDSHGEEPFGRLAGKSLFNDMYSAFSRSLLRDFGRADGLGRPRLQLGTTRTPSFPGPSSPGDLPRLHGRIKSDSSVVDLIDNVLITALWLSLTNFRRLLWFPCDSCLLAHNWTTKRPTSCPFHSTRFLTSRLTDYQTTHTNHTACVPWQAFRKRSGRIFKRSPPTASFVLLSFFSVCLSSSQLPGRAGCDFSGGWLRTTHYATLIKLPALH